MDIGFVSPRELEVTRRELSAGITEACPWRVDIGINCNFRSRSGSSLYSCRVLALGEGLVRTGACVLLLVLRLDTRSFRGGSEAMDNRLLCEERNMKAMDRVK